jgi:hypothetical protein
MIYLPCHILVLVECQIAIRKGFPSCYRMNVAHVVNVVLQPKLTKLLAKEEALMHEKLLII